MDEDEEEEREKLAGTLEVNYHEHSKKTRKRQRCVEKQKKNNSKLRQKKDQDGNDGSATGVPLFPAILLLRDPQQLAEQLVRFVFVLFVYILSYLYNLLYLIITYYILL